jgi:hypothetical protein
MVCLSGAAREGARVAVVANPTTTIDTVAKKINLQLAAAKMDTASAIKTMSGFQQGTGVPLTLTITYPFMIRWITPFLGWTGAQASFNMITSVTFRNE